MLILVTVMAKVTYLEYHSICVIDTFQQCSKQLQFLLACKTSGVIIGSCGIKPTMDSESAVKLLLTRPHHCGM